MRLTLSVVLICACGGGDPAMDGGREDGGVDAFVDVSVDGGCVPTACPVDACGPVDDGCGGALECTGGCGCSDETAEVDCPARPCETARCDEGRCAYEPVICDLELCECEGCGDDELRPCGDGCPAMVCDPQPDGVGGFANACVPTASLRCGLCDLGVVGCDDADDLACDAPDFPFLDGSVAECNGASPAATVIYMDERVEGGTPDGSREQPFTTLEDALSAAVLRGARLVVVGRSPVFVGTRDVLDGVSILGGFAGWPEWEPDESFRPVFRAGVDDVAEGRLVGLRAFNVLTPTRVSHVRIETDDLRGESGTSNLGIALVNAPMLELEDVEVVVGDAETGAPGRDAAAVTTTITAGAIGQQGNPGSTRSCGLTVVGGLGGVAICDGRTAVETRGGRGGQGSGAMPLPPGTFDECAAFEFACYHVRGEASAAGTEGGLKRRPTLDGRGSAGAAHPSPPPGAAGIAGFVFSEGLVQPIGDGGDGPDGLNGRGGGGGSNGQITRDPQTGAVSNCEVGGGGGGGGAGGCGGLGGEGGGAGGYALGLSVFDSTGARFSDVVVRVGAAGLGGEGGQGSAGLAGSAGGPGGPPTPGRPADLRGGASGGSGGPGQPGGDGGNGAAGEAFAVLCNDAMDLAGVRLESGDELTAAGCE